MHPVVSWRALSKPGGLIDAIVSHLADLIQPVVAVAVERCLIQAGRLPAQAPWREPVAIVKGAVLLAPDTERTSVHLPLVEPPRPETVSGGAPPADNPPTLRSHGTAERAAAEGAPS